MLYDSVQVGLIAQHTRDEGSPMSQSRGGMQAGLGSMQSRTAEPLENLTGSSNTVHRPWIRQFPFDRDTLSWCLALTAVIELLCVILRFGFGAESTTATASTVGVLTLGIRIHHGYLGALLIPIGLIWNRGTKSIGWFSLVIGVSLLLSDLIHHFLVLWPITGSPHFDFTYPVAISPQALLMTQPVYAAIRLA